MTRIKLCGLTRGEDIQAVNTLLPEYIGFVFAPKSRRYIPPERARALRGVLSPGILAVGVFVKEEPRHVAALLNEGIIDIAQLHGGEDEEYIKALRELTHRPLIQAFRVEKKEDLVRARESLADYILLDHGPGGTGQSFDWEILKGFDRPFFLAGGLGPDNASRAVKALRPFAVDVSSGIETGGFKDVVKMTTFVEAVRSASGKDE